MDKDVEKTKQRRISREILDLVYYAMHDSSNESQKEKPSSWLNCALQDDELYKVIQVGTWSYWVSIGRYWLIHDGIGSV